MIVGLFGKSSVGKSTVARILAADLDLPLRSCGDVVRQQSKELLIAIEQLPDSVHRSIDCASVLWARNKIDCIIEGRFLDSVFADPGKDVLLIGLCASLESRVERTRFRNGWSTFSADDLKKLDESDAGFRLRLYGGRQSRVGVAWIDTSNYAADECARMAWSVIERSGLVNKDPPKPPTSLSGNGCG